MVEEDVVSIDVFEKVDPLDMTDPFEEIERFPLDEDTEGVLLRLRAREVVPLGVWADEAAKSLLKEGEEVGERTLERPSARNCNEPRLLERICCGVRLQNGQFICLYAVDFDVPG